MGGLAAQGCVVPALQRKSVCGLWTSILSYPFKSKAWQRDWKSLLVMGVCSGSSMEELLSKLLTCKVIHSAQRKSSAA